MQIPGGSSYDTVNAAWTRDSAGRLSTVTYPFVSTPSFSVTYSYDGMGRPASMSGSTVVNNVQYNAADQIVGMRYVAGQQSGTNVFTQETMGYNANGQLTSLGWGNPAGQPATAYAAVGAPSGGVTYSYAATQNNGQIAQVADTLSNETITYQYDLLKRLTSANSTAPWTEGFQYDGFGNLTAKVLNGTTNTIAVNAATNQLTNAVYDTNGNMTSGAGATLTYDSSNRPKTATETSGGEASYLYAPDNRQIYRFAPGFSGWNFYSPQGQKMGVYTAGYNTVTAQGTDVWFAGRLIADEHGPVFADRVGTNRASGARFYPYGDEVTSTANDHEKFATYTRDGYTMLDYADQRYYASTYGRFNTPDPARSARLKNPLSWNRYSYTHGDPVNKNDPKGLCVVSPDGQFENYDFIDDPYYYGSYGYTDVFDGDCDVVANDDVVDADTPAGSQYWADQLIQQVNSSDPGGFLNSFMGYSALAGATTGMQFVELAGAFADGASAADTLLLGPGGYVDPITGAVYSGYIDIGGVVGANTVNIPADVWEAMDTGERAAALTGGITQALNSGAQVAFTINPANATGWTLFHCCPAISRKESAACLGREIQVGSRMAEVPVKWAFFQKAIG
jgi:RHS repeat-associated protein